MEYLKIIDFVHMPFSYNMVPRRSGSQLRQNLKIFLSVWSKI